MNYFFRIKIALSVLMLFFCISVTSQTSEYQKWVTKAMYHINLNQLDSASFALNRALATDPANENNSVLLLNQGVLQRHLKMYNEAYISLSAALNSGNNTSLILNNRASLLVEMNRFDDALEDYNALLQIDSCDVEALYRRGVLLLQKRDRRLAEIDFNSAEKLSPNSLFTKLGKALLYKLDDEWQKAEEIYTQIISSEKETESVYYLNRAECYMNTGQFAKAAADLSVIERAEKDNPFFYVLRGKLRIVQYDNFAAKSDFERAKQMGYDEVIINDLIKKVE